MRVGSTPGISKRIQTFLLHCVSHCTKVGHVRLCHWEAVHVQHFICQYAAVPLRYFAVLSDLAPYFSTLLGPRSFSAQRVKYHHPQLRNLPQKLVQLATSGPTKLVSVSEIPRSTPFDALHAIEYVVVEYCGQEHARKLHAVFPTVKVGEYTSSKLVLQSELADWDQPDCSILVGNLNKLYNRLEALERLAIFCVIRQFLGGHEWTVEVQEQDVDG
jgi:hypothetical protein